MRSRGDAGEERLPTGPDKTTYVREMFDRIAPRYDLANRVISLGLDRRWRRSAVRSLGLAPGTRVLDLASGTGDIARELTNHGCRCLALDSSYGMLAHARAGAAPRVAGDAAALPLLDASLDGIVSGFALRNFTDLPTVFAECARVLRPAGRVAFLEVDTPAHPLLRAGHEIWFRHVVPVIGALLSDRDAYRYLPRSLAYLPTHSELAHLIEAAGFTGVTRRTLNGGVTQIVTATRLGAYGISRELNR